MLIQREADLLPRPTYVRVCSVFFVTGRDVVHKLPVDLVYPAALTDFGEGTTLEQLVELGLGEQRLKEAQGPRLGQYLLLFLLTEMKALPIRNIWGVGSIATQGGCVLFFGDPNTELLKAGLGPL